MKHNVGINDLALDSIVLFLLQLQYDGRKIFCFHYHYYVRIIQDIENDIILLWLVR